MKKSKSPVSVLFFFLLFLFSSICHSQKLTLSSDTSSNFKDGIYEGKSRAVYTAEPYWGLVSITIRNGKLTDVRFSIRDSNLHEPFDAKYEVHFKGIPEYIQQSRNDWKGVQTYPGILMKKQDLSKVDATSGATWSYNIFKSSVKEALKDAKN